MKSQDLFLRNVRVLDPESPRNGDQVHLLISNGKIQKIGEVNPTENALVIEEPNMFVAPGLFDMQVTCGEPGHEEKETFESLSQAALSGGITDVLVMPANVPATDNRGQVEYIKKIAAGLPLNVHVAGALSAKLKGVDLAELYDMHQGGAIAFTDDKSPIENPVLLHLALQYARISGGAILVHNEESAMRLGGNVHEGEMSTRLGMKGAPALSETLGITRNIALAKYHNSPIHLSGISSEESVELIRAAKAEGLKVTCSVYAHQLYFNDTSLESFHSNFKVWPPLRTENDRLALIKGVSDGTIDVICSDHRPENTENKDVEFEFAAFGITGLETMFGAAFRSLGAEKKELLIEKMAHAPRRIMGLNKISIEEGSEARIVVFRDETFTFQKDHIRSKSSNTPFIGKELQGRILGTYTSAGGWISR